MNDVHRANLDSIVKTVNAEYFDSGKRFRTRYDRAAAYLVLLIKDHPLTDGNKRLALLWFDFYCQTQDLNPEEPSFGYDALVVAIEQMEVIELDSVLNVVKRILFSQ